MRNNAGESNPGDRERLRAWADIDLGALGRNCDKIRAAADTELIAVVKADAYGHGAPRVAAELSEHGVRRFAVACPDEARELRAAGIGGEILILGYTAPRDAPEMSGLGVAMCAADYRHASAMSEACAAAGVTARIHLKADTGMTRLGAACRCAGDVLTAADELAKIAALPNIYIEGMFTHFASADEFDEDGESDTGRESGVDYTLRQIELFGALAKELRRRGICPEVIHAANSAGAVRPEFRAALKAAGVTACRPGIILYGGYPDGGVPSPMEKTLPLEQVMSFRTRVAQLKTLPCGTPVGYGRSGTTERETLCAVLTAGYADGYLRSFGRGGSVYINGRPAPVLGRVCMDMCMADVTGMDVRVGDEAVLFGAGGESLERVAARAGTINYELCCGLSKRVPRVYSGGASD